MADAGGIEMADDVLVVGGDEVVVRVPAAATGGRIAAVEVRMAAGGGPPGAAPARGVRGLPRGGGRARVLRRGRRGRGPPLRRLGRRRRADRGRARAHDPQRVGRAGARVRRLLARRRHGGVRARGRRAGGARPAVDGRGRRDRGRARDRDDAPVAGLGGGPRRRGTSGRAARVDSWIAGPGGMPSSSRSTVRARSYTRSASATLPRAARACMSSL